MNDEDIFNHLFMLAFQSKDPRGIVVACLVIDNEIIASAVSSDDGIRHAEDILLEYVTYKNIKIGRNAVLYVTLEPCSKRTHVGMPDCTSQILKSGITNIIYGAKDLTHSVLTEKRLTEKKITIRQVADIGIVRKCLEVFNSTIKDISTHLLTID